MATPAPGGFGTRLIEFAAVRYLGGQRELIFAPDGLTAEIAFQLN